VGRVPRPTSSLVPFHELPFALSAFKEKSGRNVFGGSPNPAQQSRNQRQ
jgi:hypothetical protein